MNKMWFSVHRAPESSTPVEFFIGRSGDFNGCIRTKLGLIFLGSNQMTFYTFPHRICY